MRCSEHTRQAVDDYLKVAGQRLGEFFGLRAFEEDVGRSQKAAVKIEAVEISFKKQVQEWKDVELHQMQIPARTLLTNFAWATREFRAPAIQKRFKGSSLPPRRNAQLVLIEGSEVDRLNIDWYAELLTPLARRGAPCQFDYVCVTSAFLPITAV